MLASISFSVCCMKAVFLLLLFFPGVLFPDAVRNFWFSGAEISRYDLSQARYGANHPGHVEFIFVTEPFLVEEQVKDELGNGESTDVLKLNALRTFNTGIYSYRIMTSTFKPIDLDRFPHALKSTTSVQDWCGQAFRQVNRLADGWRVRLFSYFEEEGDQDVTLPDTWLEDELWILIRLDPSRLPDGEFEIIPGALYQRFSHEPLEIQKASGKLLVKAGQSTYRLDYPDLDRRLEITFDTGFPHIIRKWSDSSPRGTTTAVLRERIMNSEYWSENQPEDRNKRQPLGLEAVPN